jgi:hypothetical protein
MVTATEVNVEQGAGPPSYFQKNKWLLLLFPLSAVAIGVIVGVLLSWKEEPEATDAPTTAAPTLSESEYLRQLLWPISGDTLYDEESQSPQYKAWHWSAEEDELDLDIRATNEVVLLERYIMAVLYYSTGGPD